MENMNVNAQVVNENAMEVKEMTMENQNVQAQVVDEHAGKVRRFCNHCGKEMWVESNSRQSICEECREAKKAQTAKRAHELAKKRKEELGLVTMNVSIYESTRNALKEQSKAKGMSVADFLKELLEGKMEEKAQEIA